MKLEKVTDRSGRWYDDACGTAHGLELIGERWTLLVVRELMFGPKRFGDLRASLPGLSANVLTQRLEGMEASGLVVRRKLPPPASVQVYDLTDWGREAEPIISELGRWAARSPGHDPTLPLSPASMMLSFRTMFDARKAGDAEMRLGFRFGPESFVVEVAGGSLTAQRADTGEADVVILGSPEAVASFVYGGGPPEGLAIEGRREVFQGFAGFFELPPKAESARG
jgi:DNA-binding HxlR family transcriptional regulator